LDGKNSIVYYLCRLDSTVISVRNSNNTSPAERSVTRSTVELYRRRLVRSERQKTALKSWLEQGGMKFAFTLLKCGYESAFFGINGMATSHAWMLPGTDDAQGFAFYLPEFIPAETNSLVLDALVGQAQVFTGFRRGKAEYWMCRDEELGCDHHQCYELYPHHPLVRMALTVLGQPNSSPRLLLKAIQHHNRLHHLEVIWHASPGHAGGLHRLMERWLKQSPGGRDFSFLYQSKPLMHRLWK